jgi:hypothetical protein
MSNTLRPPSFQASNENKLQNIQVDYRVSSVIIDDDGKLCGIYMKKFKSPIVREILFAAALSACSVHTVAKIRNEVIAETTETDLQAALTNVVQPLQGAAAIESKVESVPSYWYNEDAAIVCQVGEYCIKITVKN